MQYSAAAALWLNGSSADADEGLQLLLQLPTPAAWLLALLVLIYDCKLNCTLQV